MQIGDMESAVGVTRKNIRFYEQEGLLMPRRQAGNGYRSYDETDVTRLQQIKLLRKLGVPIGEIRTMLAGELPLAVGMQRHALTLAHQQENLQNAQALCTQLGQLNMPLAELDAESYLTKMKLLEEKGVHFMDVRKIDQRKKSHAALLAAVTFIALMLMVEALLVWGMMTDPLPLAFAILMLAAPMVFIVGVLLALRERFKEIEGGEEDAYRQY